MMISFDQAFHFRQVNALGPQLICRTGPALVQRSLTVMLPIFFNGSLLRDTVYAIYQLNRSSRSIVDKMLSDDIIGRQAITQKDAAAFGLDADKLIIMYEGSEEGHLRLKELFGSEIASLPKDKTEEIYRKIKDEESQAEGGLGFIFG